MGHERPDMFDVASGECELLDFLLTRFNPLDLKTKINLAPTALVDEQMAPTSTPQGQPAEEAQAPPLPVDRLTLHRPAPPPAPQTFAPPPAPPPAPPKGPDWLSLIQGFHAAAQRYQAEIEEEPDSGENPADEDA